jgi:putative transcriptional regulator
MEFKEKLLYVRAKLNLTQTELANKLKVSYATINRWETEKVHPTKKAELSFDIFCKENNIIFEEGRK